MKIIKPYIEILSQINGKQFLKDIEIAGRTCYKSEDKITKDSAKKFVKMLIDRGHEGMIEHAPSISVKFICDRGISHEIVRHRLFSFAQESTRYVSYKDKDIEFIKPNEIEEFDDTSCGGTERNTEFLLWEELCERSEFAYKKLLSHGISPQIARSVLPNALKTEIIVTGNVREWRHFFKLRTAKTAHPQMREVACMALDELSGLIPILFDEFLCNLED